MKCSGYRLLMLWVALIALACPLPTRAQATQAVAPDVEMQSGLQSFRKGDFTQALQHWTAAASAYETAGNAEGQARALVRAAEAELSLGRSPDAIATLQRAQTLAERIGNAPLTLAVESSLGNAYVMSGRDADAERVLRGSVDRAQKAGDAQTAAQSLNNLGNLYALQGRFADAGGTYRQAIDAAARAGNKSIGIRASANLARALFDE
ncbi:MAG TPA: tetratricopeptide repeat protein, partial [Burkholderiales bacterium]|nr:tetratricopeptide repeat protein [Burkholderiales bacterium]